MNKRNLISILVATLVVGGIIGLNAVNATSEKTTLWNHISGKPHHYAIGFAEDVQNISPQKA